MQSRLLVNRDGRFCIFLLSSVPRSFATVLLVMWAAGYFLVPLKSAQTHDFGKFANNFLGPIDPSDNSGNYSLFLQTLPKSPYAIGGGYCFLGLGILLLSSMSFYDLMQNGISRLVILRIAPLAIVMIGLGAFSLSDKIAFGSHVLRNPKHLGASGKYFPRQLANVLAVVLRSVAGRLLPCDTASEYAPGQHYSRRRARSSTRRSTTVLHVSAPQVYVGASLDDAVSQPVLG